MNELVKIENGIVTASSRDIADRFEKRHDHVIRDIESYKKDVPNFGQMFFETTEPDSYGRPQKVYLMNRDGFSLLCMGFTGAKVLDWKLKYIEAFNAMEVEIKGTDSKATLLLQIYSGGQGGVLAAKQLTDIEVKEATTPLLATIEEQKPLVEFADHVTDSADSIDVGELAKLANKEGIDIGRNRLFSYLRAKKILMENNTPYQKYIDNGWFRLVETVKKTPYGNKIFPVTLVLGRGQIGIIEMLRKEIEAVA